jgi:fatty acid/phospholipid synthesis protein PlsX
MGGDSGPRLCISAALKFARLHPSVRLTLIGDRDQLSADVSSFSSQINILPAEVQVEMQEQPGKALRHKRESSMALAVKMVATGEADACVSGGNTGALMAFGLHLLGTMPGIERPAICKAVPSKDGVCWVLDLGANLECSAEHLRQFACMGTALAKLNGVASPRVALLNVGVENQKGRELEQETAALLKAQPGMNFIGFVEGGDIYRGLADVVVCDGFTGNALLKASEGAAELLQNSLKNTFQITIAGRLAAWLARPVLRSWISRYDPARLNGASLLGLSGVVVKSHGSASESGFIAALNVAREQAAHRIIDTMAAAVAG